ncbi:MAG: FG-GAP-like repeat-containing protein [Phycisphaerales bacterium]
MCKSVLTTGVTVAFLWSVPTMSLCQCQDPAFGAADSVLPFGARPTLRSIADVNRDGFPDLLVLRTWGTTPGNSLHLLTGRGDGSFDELLTFTDESPLHGALADMNGDGFPDLVMIQSASRITIRLNDGGGHFDHPLEYDASGDWISALYVADINADGLPDVLYEPVFEALRVRMNTGGGVLGPEIATGIYPAEQPVLLHDLTGDGRPEIVFNNVGADEVRYFSDDGSGHFAAEQLLLPYSVASLDFLDVDGGGSLDLTFGQFVGGNIRHQTWLNDGSGHFAVAASIVTPFASSSAYADLDGDSDLDLILCHSGVAAVYRNTGGAAFSAPMMFAFPGDTACFAVDQNGDGNIDLVGFRAGGFSAGDVVLLPGAGNGDFGSASSHVCQATPNARIAALADLNNDGLHDVIVNTLSFGPVSVAGELKSMTARCPCPAEFNHDGAVNTQDFFDFLAALFTLQPAADVNRDGVVNSQDFFDYLGAFFAGCP